MIPRRPIIVIAGLLAAAGVIVAFFPVGATAWLYAGAIVLFVAALDAVLCWTIKAPATVAVPPIVDFLEEVV